MTRAIWNGAVVAESDDTVIVEGNHYFPIDSVNADYLVESDHTTVCPWKGRASYYSLNVDGKVNDNAAWYYPTPSSAASKIAGRVAFWHGVKVERSSVGGGNTRAGATAGGRRLSGLFRRDRRAAAGPVDPAREAEGQPSDSRVVDGGESTFAELTAGVPVIVDFWAPWCAPCRSMHPKFVALADKHRDTNVRFLRVNVDNNDALARRFGVMSIPTLVTIDTAGQEVDREIGVPSQNRLESLVSGLIGP